VTLGFRVPAEASEGSDLAGLGVAVQDGDGYWNWVSDASRDEARKTITIAVTRLGSSAVGANPAVRALLGGDDDTTAAVVRGAMLLPTQAKVQKGKTQALAVTFCYPDGALAPLSPGKSYRGFSCGSDFPSPVWTQDWSVNDVPGGDSTHGSIRQVDRYNAVFTAPGKKPSSPVVGATTQVFISGGAPLRFHSSLEIVDARNLTGSLNVQMLIAGDTLTPTVDTADATLEWATEAPDGWNLYRLTGTWELKTPTLTLHDGTICKAQGSLRRPIVPGLGSFGIFAGTSPLFRGSALELGFFFACVDPHGVESTLQGEIVWGTWTSADCSFASVLKGVPISDPKAPKGSFTMHCGNDLASTGTWDFREEGEQ
jgi:hypothetical protein